MASEWISWRVGRNYRAWHYPDTALTTKCGTVIPPKAAKCYASAELIESAAETAGVVCAKCRALRGAERIP